MPRRTTTTTTPADLPKIDLAGRYLEYMRLREIVQEAERRRGPHVKFKPSVSTASVRLKIHRKF
jgi:hypothetical protein